MTKFKLIALILSVVSFFGEMALLIHMVDTPSASTDQTKEIVRVENVYEENYEPIRVSYWENVQNIVNQGYEVVTSTWSVGDIFIDCFNGESVIVRLVDIAEDGTCTFLMDSVFEGPLTYDILTYDVVDEQIPLDQLYSDDAEGNRTWVPLVVRGLIGEYYLVTYEPPTDLTSPFLLNYHWKANGIFEPDWTYSEAFDFNLKYSIASLGTDFDVSVLGLDYYLIEFEADEFLQQEWVELDLSYKKYISEDLKQYAEEFRLPCAEELGIGDLSANGAKKDKVWVYFRDFCEFDEQDLTVIDKQSCVVHYFSSDITDEFLLNYSSFKGEFANFWLEDVTFTDLPSRFYVAENGILHIVPKDMPLNEPVVGSFMPCFKIRPQR